MAPLVTPDELTKLEERYRVTLPDVYRQFATTPDKASMQALIGTDLSYPFVNGMKEKAAEVAGESSPGFEFESRDFVFASGQGYAFLYFKCSDRSADPAIYLYEEGQSGTKVVVSSFTDWIELCKGEAQSA